MKAATTKKRSGTCLCGAVRFEIEGPMRGVLICHCGQCRKHHGHAAAFTSTPMEKFRFLESQSLAWYRSSEGAERGFCRICGSNLFWRRVGGGTLSVSAGSIDPPTGLSCAAHLFTAFKGDYYDIPKDGLERHAEWMPPRLSQ
jgi:hypothetical protein